MRFEVLGPLRLLRDGEEIPLTSGRQRALLANLLLADGDSLSADQLIEAVWGDELPSNPANTLQHGIAQLRKILEPDRNRGEAPRLLLSDGAGYRLDLGEQELDAATFEKSLADAAAAMERGAAASAAELLQEALNLWRGRAYADFVYSGFAQGEAERLEELRVRAREVLIDAQVEVGGPESVVADLESLVVEHPLREGLWARLMRALYQSGRQAEALRTYQQAAKTLGEELGIEPSPELRELEEKILLQAPELAAPDRGPVRHNLPVPATPLIGREEALAQVTSSVAAARLTTLLGPGGSGKTRLALEAAAGLVTDFPDGVWLVRLDNLSDPGLAVAAVGEVVGMSEDREKPVVETLAAYLGDKRVLLVLDNCEHLVGCIAEMAESLIAGCPNLTILATSQVALKVGGEHRVPVPPLALPGEDGAVFADIEAVPAVALFLQRAAAVNPDVDGSPATLAAVANIVAALDGMPLAIELAAARADLLTPAEIARRLADRFEVLDSGPRDKPARQRTLSAAVEWSYGLLDTAEQDFFNRISVFAGSFDVPGAAAVADIGESETLALLNSLIQRSLAYRDPASTDRSRYRMLETLRLFGVGKLEESGDLEGARNRHLDYFAGLIPEVDERLIGPDQLEAFAEMVSEQDNVRAALTWSLESGQFTPGVAIVAWSGRFWDWRGNLAEGSTWTSRFVSADLPSTTPGLAVMTGWASYFAWELGEEIRSAELSASAVELGIGSDDELGAAIGHTGLALQARARGDFQDAVASNALVRASARAAGNLWIEAWADNHDGLSLLAAGHVAAAREAAQASLDKYESLGDRRATGWALTVLAQIELDEGDVDRAQLLAGQAVEVSRIAGDGRNAAWALELAAEAARRVGDESAAARLAAEAGELLLERGMPQSPWLRRIRAAAD